MKDHSEDGTSTWIAENLKLPEKGFYCDIGCAHPFVFSQTAFLRERGWTGVAVDGYDAYRSEWQHIPNAHFIHAVVSEEPEVNFLVEPSNAMVSREHSTGQRVQAITLDDILKFSPHVDFLSLDIEGGEFSAICSLNIGLKPPTIIVSEFRSEHAGEDFRVLHYLLARGYELVHATMNNFVFKYAK